MIYYSSVRSDDVFTEVMKLKAGPSRDLAIEALIDQWRVYENTLEQIVESDEIPEDLRMKAKARLER